MLRPEPPGSSQTHSSIDLPLIAPQGERRAQSLCMALGRKHRRLVAQACPLQTAVTGPRSTHALFSTFLVSQSQSRPLSPANCRACSVSEEANSLASFKGKTRFSSGINDSSKGGAKRAVGSGYTAVSFDFDGVNIWPAAPGRLIQASCYVLASGPELRKFHDSQLNGAVGHGLPYLLPHVRVGFPRACWDPSGHTWGCSFELTIENVASHLCPLLVMSIPFYSIHFPSIGQ